MGMKWFHQELSLGHIHMTDQIKENHDYEMIVYVLKFS